TKGESKSETNQTADEFAAMFASLCAQPQKLDLPMESEPPSPSDMQRSPQNAAGASAVATAGPATSANWTESAPLSQSTFVPPPPVTDEAIDPQTASPFGSGTESVATAMPSIAGGTTILSQGVVNTDTTNPLPVSQVVKSDESVVSDIADQPAN